MFNYVRIRDLCIVLLWIDLYSSRCVFICVQTTGILDHIHVWTSSQFVGSWDVGISILVLYVYGLEVSKLSDVWTNGPRCILLFNSTSTFSSRKKLRYTPDMCPRSTNARLYNPSCIHELIPLYQPQPCDWNCCTTRIRGERKTEKK